MQLKADNDNEPKSAGLPPDLPRCRPNLAPALEGRVPTPHRSALRGKSRARERCAQGTQARREPRGCRA